MADKNTIYRESITLHYWGSHGNGIGLLADVDFYSGQTLIRWLPQSREHSPIAIKPETLEELIKAIRQDQRRIGHLLTPNLNDEDDEEHSQ